MTQWHFYTTEGCHLCEQAWALCEQAGLVTDIEQVEITDDAQLVERYGLRIPVLAHLTCGRELNWPFDIQTLKRFVATCEA